MTVTTTPSVEGKNIKQYLGIVVGEATVGANFSQDLFAIMFDVYDIVRGPSVTFEELQKARDIAMQRMIARAQALGANAVVGVDLDYEVVGPGGSMLMVTISGTAVLLE